jgi:hypothetical protein
MCEDERLENKNRKKNKMGRDNDGEEQGGKVGMRYGEKQRIFGSNKRGERKADESTKDAVNNRVESGKGTVRARNKMLEMFKRDESDNFDGVKRYFKWLENAFDSGLLYKEQQDGKRPDATKDDIDAWELFILDADDLKIITTLGSGPGGQNVQKNRTAADVTHLPSGIHADRKKKSQPENIRNATDDVFNKLVEHVNDVSTALQPGEDRTKGIVRVFKNAIANEYVEKLNIQQRMKLDAVLENI